MRKFASILLVSYVIVLTILSLISISEQPSIGIKGEDKIYHFLAHFILTILLYNDLKNRKAKHPIIISSLAAMIYGILIEVLQDMLNTSRLPDIYDVAANSIGIIFAVVIIKIIPKFKLK